MARAAKGFPDDPFSQQALGLAKWAARAQGFKELAPIHCILGFALAAENTTVEPPASYTSFRSDFSNVLERSGLRESAEKPEALSRKFSIGPELKGALKDAEGELDKILFNLNKLASVYIQFSEERFSPYLLLASVLGRQNRIERIDAGLFLGGAYIAFVTGRLEGNVALTAFVASNLPSIQALLADRGLKMPDSLSGEERCLELDPAFVSRAIDTPNRKEPLLAVLNLGVREGARVLSKERTAYHEAGHAVVSYTLRPELTVTHVTIVDDGSSDGCTYFDDASPYWDRLRQTDLHAFLRVALSGRLAEQIRYGGDQSDAGAEADIKQATSMAWRAISTYGLDEDFGPVNLSVLADLTGGSTGFLFDRAQERVQKLLKESSADAKKILENNWAQVELVARLLISQREIGSEDMIHSLITKSLSNVPGSVRARSRPIKRHVKFATRDGVHETPEGPVRYQAGDAIVYGEDRESWPVRRSVFESSYQPSQGVALGKEGLYEKDAREVLALKIAGPRRLDMTGGRGQLMGALGDWIVDYGGDDLAIVASDVFAQTYELIEDV